jgi:hypothetical protein
MPAPINPRSVRIYRVPKPETEDGESLNLKPVMCTQAALYRTDMATDLVADNTWTTIDIPSQKKARSMRNHHIKERHNIMFASVSLNAHGSSLMRGSAKLTTPMKRWTYLSEAIDRLRRIHVTTRALAYANPAETSTSPRATEDDDNAD